MTEFWNHDVRESMHELEKGMTDIEINKICAGVVGKCWHKWELQKRFSDRCYHAIKSRLKEAEALLKEQRGEIERLKKVIKTMSKDIVDFINERYALKQKVEELEKESSIADVLDHNQIRTIQNQQALIEKIKKAAKPIFKRLDKYQSAAVYSEGLLGELYALKQACTKGEPISKDEEIHGKPEKKPCPDCGGSKGKGGRGILAFKSIF